MSTDETKYTLEESSILVTREDHSARIVWRGVWDVQAPEVGVGQFFKELLPSLVGKKVVVEFGECEYMNSSSINTLFLLVKDLNTKGIDTELHYDSAVEWQRITFRSVKTVTQTLPHIRVTAS